MNEFNTNWWVVERMVKEHQQRLRREFETMRLYRELRAAEGKQPRFHHRVLAWMGQRLVAWGQGLQSRYGMPVEVT